MKQAIVSKQINLRWNVENEDGIENYTIERSSTGNSDFIPIGKVAASNIHLYSFVDTTAGINQNYYFRLAIQENDNSVTYSEIKSAKINGKNKILTVFPNPSGGIIKVRINGYNGEAKFTLLNSIGQLVWERSKLVYDNSPLLLSLNTRPRGIYWLKVTTAGEESMERIIIF